MRKMKGCFLVMFLAFGLWLGAASAAQCDGSVLCPNNYCCSEWGYCGTSVEYCGPGCQSGPCWDHAPPPPVPSPPLPPAPPGQKDITEIIDADLFEDLLKNRNNPACEGHGFYSYNAFVSAARSFNGFGTTGNETIRKREVAAFLGQTSHETTGTSVDAPDGYTWGYCFLREVGATDPHCDLNYPQWPCVPGQKYFGRGPIQLSYNYNYGQAGEALGIDLLSNADLVATDPIISFETAIWFWMTPQGNKPSCHDVIVDKWIPSNNDINAGRVPGYGVITNIINGGLECGIPGPDKRVEDRIGYYKTFCDKFGIEYGDNLDCYNQKSFNSGVKLSYEM